MAKRRLTGRTWHFSSVKPGSANVVDDATGRVLGRVVAYRTTRGKERWTAMLRMGRANRPIGTRQSRYEAGTIVARESRR